MTYLYLLQQIRIATMGIFDTLFIYISSLGETTITFWLMGFVYWCVDKDAGAYMAWNVSLSCTASQWLKKLFNVPRPWLQDTRLTPVEAALSGAQDASFPSGHTVRAGATWGTAAFKQKDKWLKTTLYVVVILVAFSRNYLGVHTLWDILGAVILVATGIIVTNLGAKWIDGSVKRDVIICAIGCLICFVPMLRYGCLSNAGYGFGFISGWFIERRWIRFTLPNSNEQRAIRFLLGAMGILYIQKSIASTLSFIMEGKYSGFFTGFVMGLFIMAIYPLFYDSKKRRKAGFTVLAIVIILNMMLAAVINHNQRIAIDNNDIIEEQVDANQALEEPLVEVEPLYANFTDGQWLYLEDGTPANRRMDTIPHDIVTIGHRGYNACYPENTLASFQGAMDMGCDMIETDVQLTSDGRVVIYHDTTADRSGRNGAISEYTYNQFMKLEIEGEPVCDLEQFLSLVASNDAASNKRISIYLELKDIGDVEGYEEQVLAIVDAYGLRDRTVFASFNYDYLMTYKSIDENIKTLYNVSEYDTSVVNHPSDYYGLYLPLVNREVVDAIHASGSQVYVWTVDEMSDIKNCIDMGVDGICSNQLGRVITMVHPEYEDLFTYFGGDFVLPGLHNSNMPDYLKSYVMQGMTMAEGYTLAVAYDKNGGNSIMYVLDANHQWITTLRLPNNAHCGGCAFDANNGLLWVTGLTGSVYAMDWTQVKTLIESARDPLYIMDGLTEITIYQTDLVNHNGVQVASFMCVDDSHMYVGSYTIGIDGVLNCYDISDPYNPVQINTQVIPEKIQGIAMMYVAGDKCTVLVQGAQTDDTNLLIYEYTEDNSGYPVDTSLKKYYLPEGAQQPVVDNDGVWVMFESASQPYRWSCRIANDRAYKVRIDL
ncbi:MAG: phosphatase PAP2 family protein [Pseudobutyrivibrio sp.]|nr:phosphatase PAP2 family protein [Pseudobutyrivibrio sp.]